MWRAATIAGYLAATGCGSSARPPAVPVGNEGSSAPAEPARSAGECERASDLPRSVGGPEPGAFRGVVLGGDGRPVEGAQVTIGGGSRTESRDGHTVTTIAGVSQTYSHADGGFRLDVMPDMVEVTVAWNGVTVRCMRGSEDDPRGYAIRVLAPAI